jgi:hypothetical protein
MRIALLVTLFAHNHSLLGQQNPDPSPSSKLDPTGKVDSTDKPNGLRLRAPNEVDDQEPPPIEWSDSNIQIDSIDAIDSDEIFIIGSADMRLVSGDDQDEPLFVDVVSESNAIPGEPSTDEPNTDGAIADEAAAHEVDLSTCLRFASIGLSHVCPIHWLVTKPVLHHFEDEEIHQHTDPHDHLCGDEDFEPSLMADVEPSPESAHLAERKPAPRKVRMPFESSAESNRETISSEKPIDRAIQRLAQGAQTPVKQNDPDSQREQEEPKLNSRSSLTEGDALGFDAQGVDAVKAMKPVSNRREIKIDDPSKGKQIPSKQKIEPELDRRLQRSRACIKFYLDNPESTTVRSPWAVMHALLAFGSDYEMVHGTGRVNAIGWMCHNGTCRTQRMFTPKGRSFVPNVGGGVQGHEGQFMAILAQSNVPLDYPIQIGETKFTVEDLVRYEMATCKENSELTFKLIGLSYYLDSNKQWKANDGKTWSIAKLIQEELAQPIVGSACGGTHRLMGFSFSVRQRQLQNQPINGQFARAAKFVREYVAYTLQLQNPDGSFSTDWYEGRAADPNEERKVQTSGHMMEWLLFTMSDQEIKQPKIAKGIDFLLSKIYDKRDQKWPIGPRGHATRAVSLYQERMIEAVNSTPITSSEHFQPAKRTTPAPIVRK